MLRPELLSVENLKQWRENFRKVSRIELGLQKKHSVSEKVFRFLEMRRVWSARLKATQNDHRREKLNYLAEIQERLGKVAALHRGCHSSDSEPGSDSAR